MTVIRFVFDLNAGKKENNAFCQSLKAKVKELPVVAADPGRSKAVESLYLGHGRNFRTMVTKLFKNDLAISSACLRPDGKVVFTVGKELDPKAELIFMRLTRSTGWLTVRYENPDGSVVFASKDPHFLSDIVNGKNAMGIAAEVARSWTKREVVLFPSRRKSAYAD